MSLRKINREWEHTQVIKEHVIFYKEICWITTKILLKKIKKQFEVTADTHRPSGLQLDGLLLPCCFTPSLVNIGMLLHFSCRLIPLRKPLGQPRTLIRPVSRTGIAPVISLACFIFAIVHNSLQDMCKGQ